MGPRGMAAVTERLGSGVVNIRRDLRTDNSARIERYAKQPELGPTLLFFSGGSALNAAAAYLKRFTHNSIHLVTPFDSGGSSAKLRKAFDMPAVGDMRSRMIALADDSLLGHPEVIALFSHRLPASTNNQQLREEVEAFARGEGALVSAVHEPMRTLIGENIRQFLHSAPADFEFSGASIGNLILTGGYLRQNFALDPIAFLFSQLVSVRGTVRTITDENLHLKVTTASGREVVGQHLITGKEAPALGEAIAEISIVDAAGKPACSKLTPSRAELIAEAELVIFPPGSFFSSLIANLLPKGVSAALEVSSAPKVFIPNLGKDPELEGISLRQQVEMLEGYMQQEHSGSEAPARIDILLTDSTLHPEVDADFASWLEARGTQLIDRDLRSWREDGYYDELKLVEALLALT